MRLLICLLFSSATLWPVAANTHHETIGALSASDILLFFIIITFIILLIGVNLVKRMKIR